MKMNKALLNHNDQVWLETTFAKLRTKFSAQRDRIGSTIPFISIQGHYRDLMMPGGIFWWCNGFWPGILWQMAHATEEKAYSIVAKDVEDRLSEILLSPERLDHDVGFLFLLSSVADYRVTGSAEAKKRGIEAAKILRSRYCVKGKFIPAWNAGTLGEQNVSGMMIADCMMNIQLLYWASEVTGDPSFAQVASQHADTALHSILRGDGSANHIAVMDCETGAFLNAPAGQGYASGSSWSRGQGWVLYGFSAAYRHTGNQRYLDAAKQSAHYCISCLAESDWLPRVDFRAPWNDDRYDVTAGMIIASGLTDLAKSLSDEEKHLYLSAAMRILRACDEKYSNWNIEEDAVLSGGSLRYHDDRMAGASIIYGDYFFTEAVLKFVNLELEVW